MAKGKNGGKDKGVTNKATREREWLARVEAEAQNVVAQVQEAAKTQKLGKVILADLANACYDLAMQFAPGTAHEDLSKFKEWAQMASDMAYRVANFQSPTFKAVAVASEQPAHDPQAHFIALLAEMDKETRDEPLFLSQGNSTRQ